MSSALRILHVEDDPNDGELIRETLRAEGLEADVHRVDSYAGFVSALEQNPYDLILSDFALPDLNGLMAMEIARERVPEVPFILVSGTLGEDAAVESLRGGATDYVLKQRLSRLGTSVRRAIAEAAERRRRREAEDALRRSEEQLRHAQKMEAVGRLAGGVAHDFNNLLTAIIGYSQLAQERVGSSSAVRQDLDQVLRAAEMAASLTRQLLAFSRQQVLQPRVLDLNAAIAETEKMLRRLIGEDIDLRTSPGTGLGRIKADPSQIEQVILNLAVNARDAMPVGGSLTLRTENVELERGYLGSCGEIPPGRYVLLTVTDTGCGMDAETQSRIFEPFYTTKEQGKGTGLGLSTVLGIVQQSDGYLEVLSQPGEGAAFKIYLPRIDQAADRAGSPSGASPASAGTETVLLVEDEDLVLQIVRRGLQAAGYKVLEAPSRSEALALCEQSRAGGLRIDLMLSDLVMPGMSAAEMATQAARIQPGMKLLYMSGYPDRGVSHKEVLIPGTPFLQKPFTVAELLQKAREVLDGAPQRT